MCVTRFAAPQFNPDRTGWGSEFSGARWRVTWSWKIPRTPKDGCQGNKEEDGYWTSHHFYCQLTHTGSLSLRQVGLKDWVPLCVTCLHQKQKLGTFPAVNHRRRSDFSLQRHRRFEGGEWWICLALGLGSQTAIIITDPADFRAHLDEWRGFLLIFEGSHVEECLMAKTQTASWSSPPSDPHSALPFLIPLSFPRFPLVSPPPTAWLSPSYVLVSHVPLLPHPCLPSTCSESTSPTPSVSPLPCSLSN